MAIPNKMIGVSEETKGDVLILRLQGRLDTITSPLVEKKVLDNIEKYHKVLLDISDINYISSAGIMILLSLTKKLKSLSGKLMICQMDPNVHKIVKMTGFLRLISVAKDEEEALQKLCKN